VILSFGRQYLSNLFKPRNSHGCWWPDVLLSEFAIPMLVGNPVYAAPRSRFLSGREAPTLPLKVKRRNPVKPGKPSRCLRHDTRPPENAGADMLHFIAGFLRIPDHAMWEQTLHRWFPRCYQTSLHPVTKHPLPYKEVFGNRFSGDNAVFGNTFWAGAKTPHRYVIWRITPDLTAWTG
jgi:hypothetical protein